MEVMMDLAKMGEIVVAPCIFTLSTGVTLFSEGVDLSGDEVTFDMRHTALLMVAADAKGNQGIQAVRGSDSPYFFFAGKVTVLREHIVGVQNTLNFELLKNARQACSGLVLR
jgi:hypothetical protein